MLISPLKKGSPWKFLKGSIIVVEGNIASGKSTLTETLVEILNNDGLDAKLYKEPILQSYLDAFILNQQKYAFGFQMSMLIENQCLYSDALEHVKNGGIAIMDRSFMGNRVFCQVQFNKGNITPSEMNIYVDVYKRMNVFPNPDYIVYLEVDPLVNIVRCKSRDRSCESDNYDLEYFESLNYEYNNLIDSMMDTQNIIKLEWSKNRSEQEQKLETYIVLKLLKENYFS